MKLYIVNTTKDTLFFTAQDSRLYLTMQAKNKDGIWKNIEYLPSSWCGNSYHSLFLPENRYWEFTIPVYEGGFSTKLRAALRYKKNYKERKSTMIYSEEFDGSINPGQFWHIPSHSPSGLMDSYSY